MCVYMDIWTVVFVTGWNEKCGSWMADPFNDHCYQFNYLSMRKWAEARADCVNQGGDLVSITDPFEQAFIQGMPLPLHYIFTLCSCSSLRVHMSISTGTVYA